MTRRTALLLSLLSALGCNKDKPTGGAGAPKRLKIAVVPKGTTHEFWKSVHAGSVKAARELDVDIVWKGPLKEDDLKAQIDVVLRDRPPGLVEHPVYRANAPPVPPPRA